MRFKLIFAYLLYVLLTANPSLAISIRHDVALQDYLDLASEFPAVGRLDLAGFGAWCTGTLVEPNKVLTAAHCTSGFNANSFTFKLGDDVGTPTRTRGLSALSISPLYTGNESSDLSVLTLSTPILDVTPMPMTSISPMGEIGTMIGFGDHGDGVSFNADFDDLKRGAQNIISVADANTLRSDFDHPAGTTSSYAPSTALPLEGTTASGDSGGPISVDFGFGPAIVGVLHGGFNDFASDSRYGDISIWTPINRAENISYLESEGLTIHDLLTPTLVGDFDGDDLYTCSDVNALSSAVASNSASLVFDLDGNNILDGRDIAEWRALAGAALLPSGRPFPIGDINLDGTTDGVDFIVWNNHKFSLNSNYCSGDLNADGVIDGVDFIQWNNHKFTSADMMPRLGTTRPGTPKMLVVPENSGGGVWLVCAAHLFFTCASKRHQFKYA